MAVAWLNLLWRRIRYGPLSKYQANPHTERLALYVYSACPYCAKVNWAVRLLGLNISRRDIRKAPLHGQELALEGGKIQVPCLRVGRDEADDLWLYESDAIIDYLIRNFSDSKREADS